MDVKRMKLIKRDFDLDYLHDVRRIVRAAREQGFEISEQAAYDAWAKYSEGWTAEWLMFPNSNEEIWDAISDQFEEDEGE